MAVLVPRIYIAIALILLLMGASKSWSEEITSQIYIGQFNVILDGKTFANAMDMKPLLTDVSRVKLVALKCAGVHQISNVTDVLAASGISNFFIQFPPSTSADCSQLIPESSYSLETIAAQ